MVTLDRTAKVTIGAAVSCFVTVASGATLAGIAWHDSEIASLEQRAANREEHMSLRSEIAGLTDVIGLVADDQLKKTTVVQWRALLQAQNPNITIPRIP